MLSRTHSASMLTQPSATSLPSVLLFFFLFVDLFAHWPFTWPFPPGSHHQFCAWQAWITPIVSPAAPLSSWWIQLPNVDVSMDTSCRPPYTRNTQCLTIFLKPTFLLIFHLRILSPGNYLNNSIILYVIIIYYIYYYTSHLFNTYQICLPDLYSYAYRLYLGVGITQLCGLPGVASPNIIFILNTFHSTAEWANLFQNKHYTILSLTNTPSISSLRISSRDAWVVQVG